MMRAVVLLLFMVNSPLVAGDDLPAQQEPNNKFNVVKALAGALINELQQFPYPPVVAVIALVFGLVLLFNGLQSFRYTVTFACAITCGIVAKEAASSHFHDQPADAPDAIATVVGLEAMLLVGVIAHIGHKGIMVMLGAAVGFFVAHFLCDLLVINFHSELMKQVEVAVVWYSIFCLSGSVWMYYDRHEKIMAFLSPIPGGIFTASAILYFATEAFVAFGCHHDDVKQIWQSEGAVCPNNLTPKVAPWVDFFMLGFSKMHSATGQEDVGIFYNTTFNMKKGAWSAGDHQAQGYAILYDHLLTIVLWFFLTLCGIYIQRCVSRRRHAKTLAGRKAEQDKREREEKEAERKKHEQKQDVAKKAQPQPEAKSENNEKPPHQHASPSKSKWPFGGKSKVSQLEEGLIENGKGA